MGHMEATKISNIFSQNELKILELGIESSDKIIDQEYGRQMGKTIKSAKVLYGKLESIAEDIYGYPLVLSSIMFAKYSGEFGLPNLPPHFDNDHHELIINFQLSSNTSWDIGIGFDLYALEDNSAVVFNPNELAHWRPHKKFNDEEYVSMIFFRFMKPGHDPNILFQKRDSKTIDKIYQIRDKVM